jgi:hypothetical protein
MEKNYAETYLLIGMYRDLGAYKQFKKNKEARTKIGRKLKMRWNNNIDRKAFDQYFADHLITKEDIGLE